MYINLFKLKAKYSLLALAFIVFLTNGCEYIKSVEQKSKNINQYEKVSLTLAKENRLLNVKINDLKYEINQLETKNKYLQIQLDKYEREKKEEIAKKLTTTNLNAKYGDELQGDGDLVKFKVYKWKDDQMLAIAEQAFNNNEFEKSAQFYYTYIIGKESNVQVSDQILFQAGISAYKSKNHYEWAKKFLQDLVDIYPNSKYYRGAKLWIGLSNYKSGDNKKFYQIVEEFRLKYRNTAEWKVLSAYYEEISNTFRNNNQ